MMKIQERLLEIPLIGARRKVEKRLGERFDAVKLDKERQAPREIIKVALRVRRFAQETPYVSQPAY
jgi:hypothetical protein